MIRLTTSLQNSWRSTFSRLVSVRPMTLQYLQGFHDRWPPSAFVTPAASLNSPTVDESKHVKVENGRKTNLVLAGAIVCVLGVASHGLSPDDCNCGRYLSAASQRSSAVTVNRWLVPEPLD